MLDTALMQRSPRRRSVLLPFVLAPIILAGCGGDTPGGGVARLVGEETGSGALDGDGAPPASFVLRSDDGELAIEGGSGSLAPDFPGSVPIPEGWRLDASSRMAADGIIAWTTIWSTPETPEQAADRFAAGLGPDLPETLRYTTDTDGIVSVVGGWEGPALVVAGGFLGEEGELTMVTLTVSDEPAVSAGSAGAGLVDAIGGDEAADMLSSVGIGAKANGLAFALGGEFEVVDETTARLILGDGTVEDKTFDCIVVGAILDPGETVILVYPDGQATC